MRSGSFELAVPVNPADHASGASHAPVTVVEYGDFECPNCKQAAPAVKLLLARFAGRVRLVWRNFPLEEVHPHALHAALAAEAAAGQGKFWPMHDLLFENQKHLKLPQLRSYAERLELDMRRYDADMGDTVYLQRVREAVSGDSLRSSSSVAVMTCSVRRRSTSLIIEVLSGPDSRSPEARLFHCRALALRL